jgi:hypothetical protein
VGIPENTSIGMAGRRRQVEGNADRVLAVLQFGRGGNRVAADYPSGNGFGQAVGGLRERVFKIVSPG